MKNNRVLPFAVLTIAFAALTGLVFLVPALQDSLRWFLDGTVAHFSNSLSNWWYQSVGPHNTTVSVLESLVKFLLLIAALASFARTLIELNRSHKQ